MSPNTKPPLIKIVLSLTIGLLFGVQEFLSGPHLSTFASSIIMRPIYLPLILRQIPLHIYLPIIWRS